MAQGTSDPLQFSVDVLLSEPLQFELEEIIAAVAEDYPSCKVLDRGINPKTSLNTDTVLMAALAPADPADAQMISMFSLGYPDEGFRKADHTETYWRSRGVGKEAIENHKSYFTVNVTPVDDTLAARFRAARLLTTLTAVFAKLPITMAIYVKWSGHLVAPDAWIEAANLAVRGEWPLSTWISYRAGWDDRPGLSEYSVGFTFGLQQFLPYELQMEAAPLKPSEVIQALVMFAWMPLQGGSKFNDGDTVGPEEGPRYRMRMRPATENGPSGVLVMLHPDSPIEETQVFGKRPGIPTPMMKPFMRHPKKNFMRRLLGRN